MSFQKQLAEDLKSAQKAKDEATVGALRVLKSEIMNSAIAKNKKENRLSRPICHQQFSEAIRQISF